MHAAFFSPDLFRQSETLCIERIGVSGLDGSCYLISAILMYCVGGNFKVAPDAKYESVWQQIKGMTVDGARYLYSAFFGGLVFFKASVALVAGATNVLNVSLSERDDSGTWLMDSLDTEQKLGILFSITGIGCILGPLISDPLTDIEKPKALQLACVWGFVAVTVGCLGISIFHPFWAVCFFTAMRSAGSGITHLDSTFLLQKFTAKEMLGRVSALDEALATLAEALSSLLCGVMFDRGHLTPEGVSGAQGFLGFLFVIAWSMYHISGRGAACRSNDGELLSEPMKKSS
jgi:MFS family permease